jgi:hypothetical protein
MYASFKHRNKDVIFLVNNEESMKKHSQKVKQALSDIFEKGIENLDRISLITYSKNCRKVFSLVENERNAI